MAHDPVETIMALHKYWLNASHLRDNFDRRLRATRRRGFVPRVFRRRSLPSTADRRLVMTMDSGIAMSLWYASVYVVIEGWISLGLKDPVIDSLLSNQVMVDRLRRFRNATYHFQPNYESPKVLDFLGATEVDAGDVVAWLGRTHVALGRAIQAHAETLLSR